MLYRQRPAFVRRLALSLGLLGAGFIAGCGGDDSRGADYPNEQVLIVNLGGEPKALDPHVTTGIIESKVHYALYEGLVNPGPNLEPEPGVAERWEDSPDGLTWTFHLREDAKWSDGKPVTAQDFVFAFRRILTPTLASEYASMLDVIEGAFEYRNGDLKDFDQVGVKALDPRTLVVTLANPAPHFITMLFHHAFYPVPEQTIRAHGEPFLPNNPWAGNEKHVGNGPFVLKRWELGSNIQVTRSNAYWDPDNVQLNGIRFLFIDSQDDEERNFRDGQLHVTQSLPPENIEDYREDQPDTLREHPSLSIYYYGFNVAKPPLDDRRVREALNLAIDREAIVQYVLRGGQEPAYRLVPTAMPGYRSDHRTASADLQANIRRAQRLLSEAGYPNGQGFPKLEILYNESDVHRDVAEAIQRMWNENLGIESIGLLNKSWPAYLQARRDGEYTIMRAGWLADYVDPSNFLEIFKSDSGLNHTRWGSDYFDETLANALRESEIDRRMLLYSHAEKELVAEMPIIPLYFQKHIYLVDPRVKGWNLNVLDIRNYKGVRIEAE
ncbi:MAG: peptide ABC transporter substrate-binding protein [Opitutales bacterium]